MFALVDRQTQLLMAVRASAVSVSLDVSDAGKPEFQFLLDRTEPFHEPHVFLLSGLNVL